MSSLGQALFLFYSQYGSIPKKEIQEIVAFVLNRRRDELFLELDQQLDTITIEKIEELMKKREAHCPLAYILGNVEFYGCTIAVDHRVLIPRVETEVLLELVLKEIKHRQVRVVFDVCTGSGCLGIGFKKQHAESKVYLSDSSKEALEVAQSNAIVNQVDVEFLLGDLLEPFQGIPKADLVMCNPPYIAEGEFSALEPSVRDFEPKSALISGLSGLEIFKILSNTLPKYMNSGAILALEIGSMQKIDINKIFSKHPWKNLRCYQDYAGLDRFIFLEVE